MSKSEEYPFIVVGDDLSGTANNRIEAYVEGWKYFAQDSC